MLIVRKAKLYITVSGIRCDDTRNCNIQFCPPDDEHMCSKHVEARNKPIIKFSASSWLILRNILRCTVSKALKLIRQSTSGM